MARLDRKYTENDWFALDNIAKIYPMVVTQSFQNLFRLTFEMKEKVNASLLQQATQMILERFPTFQVKLKKGFFWCYFEENTKPVLVEEDKGIILSQINDSVNNKYLFRIMYFSKNIIIEYFHILCDGKGSYEFGKALVFQYLQLSGASIQSENKVITLNSPISSKEFEDSFVKHYTPTRLKDLKLKEIKGVNAYRITGTSTLKPSIGVIQGVLPLDKMLELSKMFNCSLTIFINSLILYSVFKTNVMKGTLKKALLAFVPIDLRKFYPSKTLRNFVMFSRAGVRKDDKIDTLEDFIFCVKRDMNKDTSPESVKNIFNSAVKMQRMAAMRIMPLPLKYLIFRTAKLLLRNNKHTLPISNVGISDMPSTMKEYVSNLYFTLNATPTMPISVGMNSYENKLNIVFSRLILETDIEKYFFRFLSARNIVAEITSNMWES